MPGNQTEPRPQGSGFSSCALWAPSRSLAVAAPYHLGAGAHSH